MDPVDAPVIEVANYLADLFKSGLSYRTVNYYRSAISAGHSLINDFSIGTDPLIHREMKGIRLKRPPKPKYDSLWNMNLIFELFSSWPDNSSLTRKQLSIKLATLLCLISFRQVSVVKALEISNRIYSPDGVWKSTKTMSENIFYPFF